MSHKLDILIPTLNEPYYVSSLQRLMIHLNAQVKPYGNDIKIHINDAGRFMTTGQKRNELIRNSEGEYFVQIDSDDMIAPYYVDELMKAIEQGPDVITFVGLMTTDGAQRKEFTIKLGENYEERDGRYYRYPNHLTCVRRACVESVKFRHVSQMEDFYWATEIMKKGLLKTEVHIEKWMYWYDFKSKKKYDTRRVTR